MNSASATLYGLCFTIAAVYQVAGVYLLWQAARGGRSTSAGIVGIALLIIVGVLAVQLPMSWSKLYISFGRVFVILSMLLAWLVEGPLPNRKDLTSAAIVSAALLAIFIVVTAPW